MKNVERYTLLNCIYMTFEEYQELVLKVTDDLQTVLLEEDNSLSYWETEYAEEKETYWNEDMRKTLSEYFGVEITSIHTDGCEVTGVWICYK